MSNKNKGKVYLVGAGPGAEDLITLAGYSVIAQADVIVYDHLLSENILKNKNPLSKLIYVGKTPLEHTIPQEKINRLLIRQARTGKIVVRLKGGDPLLFGRGSEEALALAKAKISFDIIPGVSAGFAVPAYAGIPLTHRGVSSQVTFVTGHEDPAKEKSSVDWAKLAKLKGTLVIFMAMAGLENIVNCLLQNGLNKDTPVAIVQWGTLPVQRSIAGKLGDIASRAKNTKITSPAIIIIGEVVKLRDKINWYETKILFGKKVLITRPLLQADALRQKLAETGANTVSFPLVEVVIKPHLSPDVLSKKIRECDWVIFTSQNAVEICFETLKKKNKDARIFSKAKIAVLGKETAQKLRVKGIIADLIPDNFTMEGLRDKFAKIDLKRKRVFIPHSEQGRSLLSEALKKQGAVVEEMFIYGIRRPEKAKAKNLRRLLIKEHFDILTFTSSSAVNQFMRLLGEEKELLKKQVFAVIGPITKKTLGSYGYKAQISAKEYTIEGLCCSIADYFSG